MNVSQLEHANAYSDSLPATDTFDRMNDAINRRRREIIIADTKRKQLDRFGVRFPEPQFADRRGLLENQLTQAEIERKRIELEIIEVARLIVAEADNGELIAEATTV